MTRIDEKLRKAADIFAEQEAEIGEIDRNALYKGFYLGAKWALSHQWVNVQDSLPEIRQEVIWHYRVRTPHGTWMDSYICDRYDGEYKPDDVEHWMPIPPLPEARKEGEV